MGLIIVLPLYLANMPKREAQVSKFDEVSVFMSIARAL